MTFSTQTTFLSFRHRLSSKYKNVMFVAKSILVTILLTTITLSLPAQMLVDGQTLYGNEWIDYSQPYHKVQLAQDGVYKITYEELQQAGFIDAKGSNTTIQMFHLGKEIPIYINDEGDFGAGDYIEFYGERNRSELDSFLYTDKNHLLNVDVSLFTDTTAYFLTWSSQTAKRFQTVQNDLTSPPPATDYCWATTMVSYSNAYSNGINYGTSGNISSRYDVGEGYTDAFKVSGQVSCATPDVYTSGPKALFEAKTVGQTGDHDFSFELNGQPLFNHVFSGYDQVLHQDSIAASQFVENNTFNITANGSSLDKFSLAYLQVTYPRGFDAKNSSTFTFELEPSAQAQYLEITNFLHFGIAPILFDLTNEQRIVTTLDNNTVKVLLPASAQRRKITLTGDSAIKTVSNMASMSMTVFDFSAQPAYDYIILSHEKLIDDPSGVIQAYANYRATPAGGSYQPLIVDAKQLYTQFGYGIDRHEVAIRNFLNLANESWSPKHLFIIGKGVDKRIMRNDSRRVNEGWDEYDLVPTFGYPHSDYLFVTDDAGVPFMAVGRIAAYLPSQVQIYLDKVIEMDNVINSNYTTIEDKAWTKRILHFGGGDANIENFIESELNSFKDIAANGTYGANVVSFFRNSDDSPQNIPQSEQVKQLIDDGAGLLSFFGHSSPSTLDFNIGRPEEYNNKGKYPIFYAIGCNTNRVFDYRTTLSEDYVFIKDKGTIGFFGSTWLTQLSNLSSYADLFYQNMSNDNYGETVGEIIRQTIEDYTGISSFFTEQVKQVLMFHGDPALKIYPSEYPDYVLDTDNSAVTSTLVNTQADSFSVKLSIINIGKALPDSIQVAINHILPDASKIGLGSIRIQSPKFKTDTTITLPLYKAQSTIGQNKLEIALDNLTEIDEGTHGGENNNTYEINFSVVYNNIKPVYPIDFGIVNTPTVTLKAVTTNAFSPIVSYRIQLDTTINFDSPLMQSQLIAQEGGLLNWQPSLSLEDNTVYYWRVSVDTTFTYGAGFDWNVASFVYLSTGSSGWNQSHIEQLPFNSFNGLQLDMSQQIQDFTESEVEFRVVTSTFPTLAWDEVAIYRDGFRLFGYWNCGVGTESMWISVFDPTTLNLRNLENPSDPSFNCFNSVSYVLSANPTQEAGRIKIMDFLQQEINPGDYVIIFTTQNVRSHLQADTWAADSINHGTNIFQLLEAQGATQVRDIAVKKTPYILMYQHDSPDYVPVEVIAETTSDVIEGNALFQGKKDRGTMMSPIIGPATAWNNLVWQASDIESMDVIDVDISGVANDGTVTLLYDNQTANDIDLSAVDANTYPYLQLEWFVKDEENNTAAQLDYWRVFKSGLPDVVLTPNAGFNFYADTLEQGELLQLDISVSNPSDVALDSVLMQFTLIDDQNQTQIFTQRTEPIPACGNVLTSFDLTTADLLGDYQLLIEANPNQDQVELDTTNNNGMQLFHVKEASMQMGCNPDNITLSATITGEETHQTEQSIFSTSVIETTELVQFKAEVAIHLQVGFHAKPGSNFSAKIEPCESNATEEVVESRSEVLKTAGTTSLTNYPNPFTGNTIFAINLPEAKQATLVVFDMNGKVVYQLQQQFEAGKTEIPFSNHQLKGGMYICRFQTDTEVLTKTMVHIKE